MGYEEDIAIDENRLLDEWRNQPALFLKYGQLAAKARRNADVAKEHAESVFARVAAEIREEAPKKPAEDAIKQMVLLDPDYKRASHAAIKAKYEADLLATAVRAFDHRKTALEYIVKLYGMEYFADPTAPDYETAKAMEGMQNDAIGEKLSRRASRIASSKNSATKQDKPKD